MQRQIYPSVADMLSVISNSLNKLFILQCLWRGRAFCSQIMRAPLTRRPSDNIKALSCSVCERLSMLLSVRRPLLIITPRDYTFSLQADEKNQLHRAGDKLTCFPHRPPHLLLCFHISFWKECKGPGTLEDSQHVIKDIVAIFSSNKTTNWLMRF